MVIEPMSIENLTEMLHYRYFQTKSKYIDTSNKLKAIYALSNPIFLATS